MSDGLRGGGSNLFVSIGPYLSSTNNENKRPALFYASCSRFSIFV